MIEISSVIRTHSVTAFVIRNSHFRKRVRVSFEARDWYEERIRFKRQTYRLVSNQIEGCLALLGTLIVGLRGDKLVQTGLAQTGLAQTGQT
jgi:hypothetical protein